MKALPHLAIFSCLWPDGTGEKEKRGKRGKKEGDPKYN